MSTRPRVTTLLALVFLIGPTLVTGFLRVPCRAQGVQERQRKAETWLEKLDFRVVVDAKKLEDNHIDLFEFGEAVTDAIEKIRPKNAEQAGNISILCSGKQYQLKSLAKFRDKNLEHIIDKLNFTVEVNTKALVAARIEYSEFERALAYAVVMYRPKNAEEAGNIILSFRGKFHQLKSLGKVREMK